MEKGDWKKVVKKVSVTFFPFERNLMRTQLLQKMQQLRLMAKDISEKGTDPL